MLLECTLYYVQIRNTESVYAICCFCGCGGEAGRTGTYLTASRSLFEG